MTDDVHLLAAAYALDAVDPFERRRFEAHYRNCEECSAEVVGFRAVAAELAAATAVSVPASLKDRVLAEAAATRQLAPPVVAVAAPPLRRRAALLAAAAAVVVAVAGSALVARDAVEERNQAEELASVVAAPDSRIAPLEGEPDATLRVVWSPSAGGAVVLGAGLRDPGDDLVYELWALTDDGPVSAGVFEPDERGEVRDVLELPAEPEEGWGVTIEPDGGSPQPTSDVLFVGSA